MRILVAEDDLTIRTWLKVKLKKWGYETDLAEDGMQAIELYQQHTHALVLTDWMMPRLDGIGLIQKIRETTSVSKTYIILVTAKQESGDVITGIEAGADDYIVKPVQSEELRARIIAAIRILSLEEELQKKNDNLEFANMQMKNDLIVAARIQQSFLPHTLPQFQEIEFEWGLLPCDELAGDALNVIKLDDNYVGFYLLDVSGHGVAAALLAMTLIHTLSADKPNSVLFESKDDSTYRYRSPARVAEILNNQFPMDDINGQYFTIVYGVISLDTRVIKYVAAGHPGPIVIPREGDSKSLPTTGMPIGFLPDAAYEEESIQLQQGDRFYFFSDGIPETTNKYDEQYGLERMNRILQQQQLCTLRMCVDNLAVSAIKWNGQSTMNDDVSILGLEIK